MAPLGALKGPMAKNCTCHADRAALLDAGFTFHTSTRLMRKLYPARYHEHRCECACGCKKDTQGYAFCPYCHFECAPKVGRREVTAGPGITQHFAKLLSRARSLLPHLKAPHAQHRQP